MIQNWGDFKYYLRADLASCGVKPSPYHFIVNPCHRYTLLLRLHEYAHNTNSIIRIPVKIWRRLLEIKLGYVIHLNVFGPGLCLLHYGSIMVTKNAVVGKNCRLHICTHITETGELGVEGPEYSPRIGDNCYIGPGSKIYGPITIGDNCVIAANAVVTKSFPEPGLTLGGIPAKVIATGGTGDKVVHGADMIPLPKGRTEIPRQLTK
ncbi:MAG: DapH/DapD/GlmU-related protein [Pseudomonadota bacterium]